MTNSTDKAAASAAIRVAPRRGRVKAGVVLDRDGVTVVQSREGIDAIETWVLKQKIDKTSNHKD